MASQPIIGIAASRGIAIGRAVLAYTNRSEIRHYLIDHHQVRAEIKRLARARDKVIQEITQGLKSMPHDAPAELAALLEVHLMLLQDNELKNAVVQWIKKRRYNAEWALASQLEVLVRQFDAMEDSYLRARKIDIEQVVDRILLHLVHATKDISTPLSLVDHLPHTPGQGQRKTQEPLILVAHDLSPMDMLNFRQSIFAGFITDIGTKTSHAAIVASSMHIPAVLGTREASQQIVQDDLIILDGSEGLVIQNPTTTELKQYRRKQNQFIRKQQKLLSLLNVPAITQDGLLIELLANIEEPQDVESALGAGAVGVGLFRSEFLFMGRSDNLPDEEEQYLAYKKAVEGMQGLPITIRTIDIGADKPIKSSHHAYTHASNPALGLRAIRWCLAEPAMFLTQLKAILRAANHGKVKILLPMVGHIHEIKAVLNHIKQAQLELDQSEKAYGQVELGAMIEIPAAALCVQHFLPFFDFLSIGTNDLIQYTLAIDRTNETVAPLYDTTHPAVLQLIYQVIQQGQIANKPISVCGEMAGDPGLTKLLLGLGLRSFSMHPSHILEVKQAILQTDTINAEEWAMQVLQAKEPEVS